MDFFEDIIQFDVIPCQQRPGQTCAGYSEHFDTCYMHNIKNTYFPDKTRPAPALPDIPAYQSYYEVTLTSTKDDPYELRQWVSKIAKSKMFGSKDMPYCIELTKRGLPHIHALLCSDKKYIDSTKIKSLGFPYRYTCDRVKNLDAFNNYINKEKNNPLIIDYCKRKGIPQFDNAVQKEEIQPQEEEPRGEV